MDSAVGRPPQLIGRDLEWASIQAFLREIESGATALALEGEPGIGKTALWQAAIDAAAIVTPARRVLRARPTGVDSTISYAILLDLFDGIPESALAALPPPQREAIDVALRRRPPDEGADAGTIGVAALGVVRTLAEDGPVLIAVDDLQEADPAGLRVLEFIVRRLTAERVGILLARRTGDGHAPPLRLAEALPAERLRSVALTPMTVGALSGMINERLGISLPRPVAVRIHATTRGNPQFALEIARELKARGLEAISASAPLPIPGTVQEVIGERIARLDLVTRRVVAAAAEMERPTRKRLLRIPGDADVERALEAAITADVLVAEGDAIRFLHPIVRATAALAVPEAERRAVNAHLAELADDPEERAHHLGRATVAPSEAVATALEAGAEAATSRSAPESALHLRERALELTPAHETASIARRKVALADAVSDAGDFQRARSLLAEVLEAPAGPDPATRAEASILLATLFWYDDGGERGRRLLHDTLDRDDLAPIWRARVYSRLALLVDDDLRQAAAHAEAALDLLDPVEDPGAYAFALLNRALWTMLSGGPPDHEAVREGARIQASVRRADISAIAGTWPKYADQFDESRGWFEQDVARLRALGDEGSLGQTMGYLAELEAWTGNLRAARAYAQEALDLIRQIGQQGMLAVAISRLVLVDWMEGRDGAARDGLAEMRELYAAVPDSWVGAMCEQTEAMLAIGTGDLARADQATTKATELLNGAGLVEPAMYRFHADQIEAVIGLGELDRAERLLERFEERNRVFPRPWIAATSARCRALLSTARGDHADAAAHLDRALAAHADLDWPLERIRTLIAGAQVLRRANKRKRAHELATEAARLADELGAPTWAGRARSEAARLGIEHGDRDQLTPSERRIAELAADGETNRAIADRLLVSPKTVEATLARAYSKLGIRTRAQLHARLREDDPSR